MVNFYAFLTNHFLNFNPFLACSQRKHVFWISLDKGLKKQKSSFLFSVTSSDLLLVSFYASLFIFEEIFYWIAWVTFRWIVVLFSFSFNFHKTNYLWKRCKKELKKSHWLNNVHLQVISRLDLFTSKSPCSWFYYTKKDKERV